jgi:hypothetical protein
MQSIVNVPGFCDVPSSASSDKTLNLWYARRVLRAIANSKKIEKLESKI